MFTANASETVDILNVGANEKKKCSCRKIGAGAAREKFSFNSDMRNVEISSGSSECGHQIPRTNFLPKESGVAFINI